MIHRRIWLTCLGAIVSAGAGFTASAATGSPALRFDHRLGDLAGGQAVLSVPNDTCGTASVLPLNVSLSGTTIGATNDYQLTGGGCFGGVGQSPSTAQGVDAVYTFEAPAAGNYSFRVVNYAATSNLVLYTASDCPAGVPPVTVNTCLAAANRRVSGPAEEVYCLPLQESATVWIYVDEAAPAGGSGYIIEASACNGETVDNELPDEETASGLTCGDEGAIDPNDDVDFWTLGALMEDARVFALIDGVSSDTTDYDLRVTTATDTLEFDDLNNDVEYGADSPNVGGTPLNGEDAYLRVSYHESLTASEPYRLYATAQPAFATATAESEPNNTRPTADSAANNYFYGNLPGPAPSNDVDYYSFQAAAGELFHFGLDGDPLRDGTPINPQMSLFDGSGTVLRAVNDGSANSSTTPGSGTLDAVTPFSPAEGMVYRIQAPGTYYLEVKIGNVSPTSNGAGDYLLSIARECQPSLDPADDTDGDGSINSDDCAPLTPGVYAVPLEATNLRIHADKATVEWDSASTGAGSDTVHHLIRGHLEDLPVSGQPTEICLLFDDPATSYADTEVPPVGRAFYYLASGHNNCGDGTYGFATDGSERISKGPNKCE